MGRKEDIGPNDAKEPSVSAWLIGAFAALILFANHYNRDVTGALQTELESDIPMSPFSFGLLNSLFFLPNIISPIVMGILQDTYDATIVFLIVVFLSAITQIGFGIGCSLHCLPILITSRALTGVFYEAIDTATIPITVPFFTKRYSLLSGLTNGFLRLGSVANFVLSPILYKKYGLSVAIWSACVIAILQVVYVSLMKCTRDRLVASQSMVPGTSRTASAATMKSGGGTDTSLLQDFQRRLVNASNLPRPFWMYLGLGMAAYSAFVPFYSVGSGILQRRYSMDTSTADMLLLLPEGTIAITGPLIGLVVDYISVYKRVIYMGIAALCFAPVFAALALLSHPITPYIAMSALGVFWSIFNAIFWGLVSKFCSNGDQVGISVGFLGCSVNLGPSVLLLAIGVLQSSYRTLADEIVLLFLSACTLTCAAMCVPLSGLVDDLDERPTTLPVTAQEDGDPAADLLDRDSSRKSSSNMHSKTHHRSSASFQSDEGKGHSNNSKSYGSFEC